MECPIFLRLSRTCPRRQSILLLITYNSERKPPPTPPPEDESFPFEDSHRYVNQLIRGCYASSLWCKYLLYMQKLQIRTLSLICTRVRAGVGDVITPAGWRTLRSVRPTSVMSVYWGNYTGTGMDFARKWRQDNTAASSRSLPSINCHLRSGNFTIPLKWWCHHTCVFTAVWQMCDGHEVTRLLKCSTLGLELPTSKKSMMQMK